MISTRAFARVGRAVSLLSTSIILITEERLADRTRLRISGLYVYSSLPDPAGGKSKNLVINEMIHSTNMITTAIEGQELRHRHR